jgi:hypothetical protein
MDLMDFVDMAHDRDHFCKRDNEHSGSMKFWEILE